MNASRPTEPRWKHFERLVAAIHKAAAQGGKVTWNDKIDGRQFDATIRFEHALYTYLTVIECRDYEKRVPISDVEAFVTKARSAGANKAVMVSSSGYQSGCYDVARQNHIGLYTLKQLDDEPEGYLTDELTPAIQLIDVELEAANGSWVQLRDDGGALAYYLQHTRVIVGGSDHPIWKWIEETVQRSLQQLRRQPTQFIATFPKVQRFVSLTTTATSVRVVRVSRWLW